MNEVEYIKLFTAIAPYFLIALLVAAAIYIYVSIATMVLARKIGTKHAWLAWIPFANFYLYSKMAGMHWWPIFLLVGMFIPYLEPFALLAFAVFNIIWFWKVLEKVEKPGWWVLLNLIPLFGWLIFLVLYGVAAWSSSGQNIQFKTPAETTSTIPQKTQPRKVQPKPKEPSRLDRVKKLKGSLK